ncbi:hypothetical protein [Levilactobacillus namurensis]|uniref:Uncharacterized protein n=1 Tax=Levilactobacillus namurensis TaxID=380393 RepID=A0AAW8W3X5_9LACO|nr:hypothetical protein [Levilactobacillus namurensis]MDT7013433.1 hypothetical protein [Levilactobacillus namurensis]
MWHELWRPWREGAASFRRWADEYSPRRLHWFGLGLIVALILGIGLITARATTWGYGLLGVWFFPLADYLTLQFLRWHWPSVVSLIVGTLLGAVVTMAVMLGCAFVFHD